MQFLELDESQVEALLMTQSDNAQALGLLARSIGENQRELQRELLADSPDEATVGRLLLAGRAIQREINLLRQSQLEAAPDALNLSSGQREKLDLLRVSLRVAGIAQLAARLNLVGGPRAGPSTAPSASRARAWRRRSRPHQEQPGRR